LFTRRIAVCLAGVFAVLGGASCSASGDRGSTHAGTGGEGGGDLGLWAGEGVLAEEPPCEGVPPNEDRDGDGWTGAQGDCNDCTALMNPGALDYVGNKIDDDCNGTADDAPGSCDEGLALDGDATAAARALGLCQSSQGDRWGLVSARYVTADGGALGDPLGHGLLARFGDEVEPQEGARVVALSSGAARNPGDLGFWTPQGYDKGYASGSPPGYPKESPSCPGVVSGDPHDSVALEVKIKTPTNARSLSFNLNFYTYEFPLYICSIYNDFFVAMLSPVPEGLPDGNISFDSQGNTISVNASFLSVCHPQSGGGKTFPCPSGPGELAGTGFDIDQRSAATGWLVTRAPLPAPGEEITLFFAIWDSGDGNLDSTVLLDRLSFDPTVVQTGTTPAPVPK
jgi:hypothetical protein